jgi:hypothetical protein
MSIQVAPAHFASAHPNGLVKGAVIGAVRSAPMAVGFIFAGADFACLEF